MSLKRDSALLFSLRAAAFVVQAGTGILLARLLGPHDRGIFALLALLPTATAQLLTFGLNVANAYFISRDRRWYPQIYDNSFGLALGIGGLAAFAVALLAGELSTSLLQGAPTFEIGLVAMSIPALLLWHFHLGIAQGLQRFGSYGWIQLLRPASFGILLITGILFLQDRLQAATLAFMISYALAATWLAASLWPPMTSLKFHPQVIKMQVRYAWPAHVAQTASFLFMRADLLIISALLDQSAAGYFTVVTLIAETIWLFAGSVGEVLLPVATARKEEMRTIMPRLLRQVMLLTALALGVFGLSDRQVLRFAFGEEFLPALTPLRWAYLGILARAGTKVIANYILSAGQPGVNALIATCGLILSLTLDWLLIPHLGLAGAALAMSGSSILILLWQLVWLRRVTGLSRTP